MSTATDGAPVPFMDHFVTVQGRRVGYVDLGPTDGAPSAPPLLLLHGAGLDHAELSWLPVIPAMARHRRVIVPDLPGYGESDGFDGDHSLADMGRWLVAFLDDLGLHRIDASGISMGGGMALWLALHHPARVRRLIPVASYGLMDRAPLHDLLRLSTRLPGRATIYGFLSRHPWAVRVALREAYADRTRIDDDTVRLVGAVAGAQAERQSFDAFLRGEARGAALAGSLVARLGAIPQPVLLIHGTRDGIVPVRHARAAAARIPHARLVEWPAGHWPAREWPDRFAATATAFLDGDDPVWPADARAG